MKTNKDVHLFFNTRTMLFLVMSGIVNLAKAQIPLWGPAHHIGGPSYEYLQKVRVDDEGNRYIIGVYEDSVALGEELVNDPVIVDMFVAKLDEGGDILWAHNANAIFTTTATDLAIDENGNCYVTGYYRWNARFGHIEHWDSTMYQRPRVLFLTKIDPEGTIVWSISEENVPSAGSSLTTDPMGNIYVTGFYSSTPFNPNGPELQPFSLAGLSGPAAEPWGTFVHFTAKLDPEGQGQWITTSPSNGETDTYVNFYHPTGRSREGGSATKLDVDGNIYACISYFASSISVGQDTFNYSLTTDTLYKTLIIKYTPDGSVDQANSLTGTGDISVLDMTVDAASSSVYITGMFSNAVTIGSTTLQDVGERSTYIARMTTSGAFDWAMKVGGTERTLPGGLIHDDLGSVYAGGTWTGTLALDGQSHVAGPSGYSAWILKVSPTGDVVWTLTVNNGDMNGIAILPSGELVVGLTFDDQIMLGTEVHTSNGNEDFVLAILSSTLDTGFGGSISQDNGPLLYPNPTSGSFKIAGSDISSVEIFDMLGKVVHVGKAVSFAPEIVIDATGYPEGAYLVNISCGERSVTKRLIIQQ